MSVCDSQGDEADRELWRHRLFDYLDKAFTVSSVGPVNGEPVRATLGCRDCGGLPLPPGVITDSSQVKDMKFMTRAALLPFPGLTPLPRAFPRLTLLQCRTTLSCVFTCMPTTAPGD
jgi:hypothetical protein